MTLNLTATGYAVPDITALLAIPAINRPPNGSTLRPCVFVAGIGWHEYAPSATSGGFTPADNPINGRWFPVGREVLKANRTYFVRTDGSDSNNGLANTSGGAFLTIQKARDVVNSLDLSVYTPTIKIADGTYNLSENIIFNGKLDSRIIIQGNVSTPANVIINGTANWTATEGLLHVNSGEYLFEGFKIQSSTFGGGSALIGAQNNGKAYFNNIDFGVTAAAHLWSLYGGFIEATGNYSISGGATRHCYANANGYIRCQSRTITISSTPNFFQAFAIADYQGILVINGCTFSGSATGTRYIADALGQIIAFGGASYLPGNVVGLITNGGQYL